MNRKIICLFYCLMVLSIALDAARWNEETEDWSGNPNPKMGDWGFNRPGYPDGLYIHGITVPEGKDVTNPVIYDNDIIEDVLEDEWAFMMADLGKMNLSGFICTPVLTDFWHFYHPEWKDEFREQYDRARNSNMCMNAIPRVFIGTEAESEKEGEFKLSEGARLYVDIINKQYRKNQNKPVIVNMGGQAATLASAFGMDSSIAGKCIVYYTDMAGYNGHYAWASELIARNFLVVNFGKTAGVWWKGTECQNGWNVLPRPDGCGCPPNNANSGEWAQINHDVPLTDHFIKSMQTECWYYPEDCGGCKGHSGAQCSDGYFDGTFIHAWAPGFFTDAKLETHRKGKIIQIKGFSEEAVKAVTFPVLINLSFGFI